MVTCSTIYKSNIFRVEIVFENTGYSKAFLQYIFILSRLFRADSSVNTTSIKKLRLELFYLYFLSLK